MGHLSTENRPPHPMQQESWPPPPQYAPPPPQYASPPSAPFVVQQPPQLHTHTTIVNATIPGAINYGPNRQQTICPNCHCSIVTSTESKSTTRTHVWALVMCLCLLWPCCLIPYCSRCCKNIDHHCPQCKTYLGTYRN